MFRANDSLNRSIFSEKINLMKAIFNISVFYLCLIISISSEGNSPGGVLPPSHQW